MAAAAPAPITFDDDGNAVTGVTAEGPPPLFPAMRRAPPPPQDPSARDEALLRYRRSLSSAWRNSCYFLDAEPAAKRYPEVTFVRYGDRGAVSEAKRADAGAAKLARLAETNKKWFPAELRRRAPIASRDPHGGVRERGRGRHKRGREGVNDDDDPNVNDPNVTVWNAELGVGAPAKAVGEKRARGDGDMSRLDRLARLEEGKTHTSHATEDSKQGIVTNATCEVPAGTGKKRDARALMVGSSELADERVAEAEARRVSGTAHPRGDGEKKDRRDEHDGARVGKPKPGEEEEDEMEHGNGDEDDWDEEDDYQQGGNFDDDDGYDDDFQDDGEGGDAFF